MGNTLYNTLIERKVYLTSVTSDHVIELFDTAKCKEIDERAEVGKDPFVQTKRLNCIESLAQGKVDHCDHLRGAFDLYNEIVVYDILRERASIKPIIGNNTTSMPDFIMTTKKGDLVNIDLKTFHYRDAKYNYKHIQQQHTHTKIALEKRVNGERYNESELTIYSAPFQKVGNGKPNRKDVIETFISKILAAYKPKQLSYNGNPGVLLIDTKVLHFPVFMQEALPYFLYPPLNTLMSGASVARKTVLYDLLLAV